MFKGAYLHRIKLIFIISDRIAINRYYLIMSPPRSFTDQYNRAQKTLQNAINNNFTVVLWGKGANGKTHLVNEFSKQLIKKGYYHTFYTPNNDYYSHDSKMIIETNDINCINDLYISENCNGLVFINMNTFQYPKYTRLRSGKM